MQPEFAHVTQSRIHHKPKQDSQKKAQNEKKKQWKQMRQDTRGMFNSNVVGTDKQSSRKTSRSG